MMDPQRDREALAWQTGVWDRMSDVYLRDVDRLFAPVVDALIRRSELREGKHVLDLGTGTGAVARRAAAIVGPRGRVTGTDISTGMLARARQTAAGGGLSHVAFVEGRAEAIPIPDGSVDAVLACLVMMYVIDREAAARQIARVLKPGGRFVAAVWAGPERCDIVRFQETAGRFAGPPPAPGVGPGALADPGVFIEQLHAAGIRAHVETETLGFDFPDFTSAWNALAGVTASQLSLERQQEAREAAKAAMDWGADGPRHFRNDVRFIVGRAKVPIRFRWARDDEIDWVNQRYAEIGFQTSEPGVRQVVAEAGAVPAGLGRLVPVGPGAFELGGIVVFADHRGRGIARETVQFLIDAAPEAELFCLPFRHLEAFYAGMGFRTVGESEPIPAPLIEKLAWCDRTYPGGVALLRLRDRAR